MILFLSLGYILLMGGYAPTRGLYQHVWQIVLLVAGWLVLFLPLVSTKLRAVGRQWAHHGLLLLLVAAVSMTLFAWADGPMYLEFAPGIRTLAVLRWGALVVFCAYVLEAAMSGGGNLFPHWFSAHPWWRGVLHYRFIILISIAILLRVLVIFYVPFPRIDVFFMMQGGPDALMRGENPYGVEYPNPFGLSGPMFTTDNYGYPPGMILVSVPLQIFFYDVRFGYLIAQLIAGCLVYLIARHGGRVSAVSAELLVILFLYIPHSLFVTEQSWNEPYLFVILAFIVYCVVRQWRALMYMAAGFFLSMKQTVAPLFLAFALHAWNARYTRKGFALMMGILSLVIIPFIIWNGGDLLHDTIFHHAGYKTITHALSVSTLYWRITGRDMPATGTLVFAVGFLVLAWLRIRKEGFALLWYGGTLFLLGVFILQRGFANYYYFISASLVLLWALLLSRDEEEAVAKREFSEEAKPD